MRLPTLILIGTTGLALGVSPTNTVRAQTGGVYNVPSSTIDGGGGTSTSSDGRYVLSGTIGQPDAGEMTGNPYEIGGGFWGGGRIARVAAFGGGAALLLGLALILRGSLRIPVDAFRRAKRAHRHDAATLPGRTPLALVLLLLAATAGAAPLGTAFTYQGKLQDGGVPANGDYDLEFRLYDSAELGLQQGATLTLEDVLVEDGIFSAEMDFGAAPFNGMALYLQISVRPGASTGAFTLLKPRQPLTAAPYARYASAAGNAATLGGQSPAAFATAAHDHFGETWSGSETGLTATTNLATSYGLVGINTGIDDMDHFGAGVRGRYEGQFGVGVSGSAPEASGVAGRGRYGTIGTSDTVNGIGVLGFIDSSSGFGVVALGSGATTTALRVEDGAIQVTGANRPIFVHTATVGVGSNACSGGTVIDNPFANGNENAILIVLHNMGSVNAGALNSALGVVYDKSGNILGCASTPASSNHWVILREDGNPILTGTKFNVMVVNP